MNTKHRLIAVLSSIALAACCVIGISTARAQFLSYNLTDLGVVQGEENSSPAAIDEQGSVAGTSGDCAFRYTHVRKIPMEDVGRQAGKGTVSRGFGINATGLVVGDSNFGKNVSHAAIFSNGSVTDLGTLKGGGAYSRANGISAAGQVIGFSSEQLDSEDGRAFILNTFDRSGMIDLGTLGGAYAQAWGINDSGFVTGNAQTADKSGAIHAFIWHPMTRMVDLGTLGGSSSYGTFINAQSHVVGYSTIDKRQERVHAFLHDGNEMIDLGSLGGASLESDRSYALGVNAHDQVVGYSYLPSVCPTCEKGTGVSSSIHTSPPVAFLYQRSVMANLNDMIGEAAKNYRLETATAINDKGQIAVIAYNQSAGAYHAVVLTPATEVVTPIDQITASATYAGKQRLLTVQAICTGAGSSPTQSTLAVYATGTSDALIGTLSTKNGGNYFGSFFLPSNPLKIAIESNKGGRVEVTVGVTSAPRTLSGGD